ncbi:hypothetical protein CA13_24290 [Planctomycetes bacterium CA13]|uniref:DUF4013 domain-containing protein n=1 Tax=Novipirellula herctigrandis TaxID=2527986 RepID=A0A5C5Z0S9_9BACT|nr:hypothetical protein CA13_24290 [Planctomycetes bacterium CA13]
MEPVDPVEPVETIAVIPYAALAHSSELGGDDVIEREPIEAKLVQESQTIAKSPEKSRKDRWPKRVFLFVIWATGGTFCIASLVVILAVLTAIPVLQLIAFGYLLDVAGRLVNGATFSDSLLHLPQAGKIGLAATAVFIASLPTQLLVHWESVSQLINPGSSEASQMRLLAIVSCFFALGYLAWAWIRGGDLKHYLWPQPIRFVKESWRWRTWKEAPDRLWEFTASLEIPRLFWLGLRGFVGTLVWLIPAVLLITVNRNGETGAAGLVGVVCVGILGVALLYLPMLQAHFAAENRWSALFELRTIRRDFRRAPWAWFWAMVVGLVLMPVPLYLLKIEATPREVMWLPCLVFVAFILPARIAEGLALRRARRAKEPAGAWPAISRWTVRLLMPVVVATYLVFVQVSQYTSWDGLQTWIQQHAILIPVPFVGV